VETAIKKAARWSPFVLTDLSRIQDLPIQFVMTADVEQNDLMLADQQGQGNTVGIDKSDGMASGKLAGELMKAEARLKRVLLQSTDGRGEAGLEIGVFP
jgi:hypothetical protein